MYYVILPSTYCQSVKVMIDGGDDDYDYGDDDGYFINDGEWCEWQDTINTLTNQNSELRTTLAQHSHAADSSDDAALMAKVSCSSHYVVENPLFTQAYGHLWELLLKSVLFYIYIFTLLHISVNASGVSVLLCK